MMIGMLWADTSKDPLEVKVQRAVEYYLDKYGTPPTLCHCHPAQAAGVTFAAGVEVKANKHIRPNHFWIGMSVKEAQPMS